MGRQEERMDPFGYDKFEAFMTACLIKDEQDPLRRACTNGLGEMRQRSVNIYVVRTFCGHSNLQAVSYAVRRLHRVIPDGH
jgi:hypothetical protein